MGRVGYQRGYIDQESEASLPLVPGQLMQLMQLMQLVTDSPSLVAAWLIVGPYRR